MENEICKNCRVSKWFSNKPKPDCRILYDLEEADNPVTKWVYREILKNREKNGTQIGCPFK